MKILFPHVFLITIMVFAVTGLAWGQDAGMSDVEIVNENSSIDTERMVYSPGEAEVRYIPRAAEKSMGDSVAIHVVEAKMPERNPKTKPSARKSNRKQPAKEEDDSILSFNFLYYIIQKYKLQDIVD